MPDRPAPTVHLRPEEGLSRLSDPAGERSVALFRHGSLVVKLYAPIGHDPQTPHIRDEAYVVAAGTGIFFDGERRRPFSPGTFLFAEAGRPHRFEDFSEDLAVWVLFYGPEGGEVPA
jgi:mannose-6-phosphate isomerase-like protein (cupin superfamily)